MTRTSLCSVSLGRLTASMLGSYLRKSKTVHKRAWIKDKFGHRAVAYCTASLPGKQPTTTDNKDKVTCKDCIAIMEGRGAM